MGGFNRGGKEEASGSCVKTCWHSKNVMCLAAKGQLAVPCLAKTGCFLRQKKTQCGAIMLLVAAPQGGGGGKGVVGVCVVLGSKFVRGRPTFFFVSS